jgi:hypothetical protein
MNPRINFILFLLLAGTLACALAAGLMSIPH